MQRVVLGAAAVALFLAPAAVFGAGFAKQSLFLSKLSVTEGETVLIHAVVNNDGTTAYSGTLRLSEGTQSIGSVPVSLDAGEAQVATVSWKPTAGSHAVVAELKTDDTLIEKQSATFVVAKKPEPVKPQSTPQAAAAVESSQNIQDGIANFSPAAADATAPVFALIDGGRAKLADVLEGQIASTKKSLGPGAGEPGEVLGADDIKNSTENPAGGFWYILQTLYLYLLTLLSFVVGSAGVFYPVLALVFFYLLWRIIRRFRRPAY